VPVAADRPAFEIAFQSRQDQQRRVGSLRIFN
jgi:hypothetical protein